MAEPPARRAGLGRGEEPGGHHQGRPVPGGLVAQLAGQFPPGGVVDGPRQVPVLHQILHRQVLDADSAVGLGDGARDPMGEVVAPVGHPPVEAPQTSACLGRVGRPGHLARKGPRSPGERRPGGDRVARRFDTAPLGAVRAGHDDEVRKPPVNADEGPPSPIVAPMTHSWVHVGQLAGDGDDDAASPQ